MADNEKATATAEPRKAKKKTTKKKGGNKLQKPSKMEAIDKRDPKDIIFEMFDAEEQATLLRQYNLRKLYSHFAEDIEKITGSPPKDGIIILDIDGNIYDPDEFNAEDDEDDDGEEYEDDDGEEYEDDDNEHEADDIAERLDAWMTEYNVTQATVAKRLKVTQATISSWLQGNSVPRSKNIASINKLIAAPYKRRGRPRKR